MSMAQYEESDSGLNPVSRNIILVLYYICILCFAFVGQNTDVLSFKVFYSFRNVKLLFVIAD